MIKIRRDPTILVKAYGKSNRLEKRITNTRTPGSLLKH